MTGEQLRHARERKGWAQQEAARRLGVSQPYLSLLEKNRRRLPGKLAQKFLAVYRLAATAVPLSDMLSPPAPADVQQLAEGLAALGYPGLSYLRSRLKWNPAELLLTALREPDLDSRIAEALPWLVLTFVDLDWDWLLPRAKMHDLQNRLGFVIALAGQVAERTGDKSKANLLADRESGLYNSRLAREETLCHDSLSEAERCWLREHRAPEARRWNLLTDLFAEHLTHAA